MQRRALECVQRKGTSELEREWKPIRRGWYLGSEEFGEKMAGLMAVAMSGKARSSFSGPAALAHDEACAKSLLRAGLLALDVDPKDLKSMRKLDVRKQVIAWWVRKQTLVSNQWVSEALCMGYPGNLSKVMKTVEEGKGHEVRRLKKQIQASSADT
jgi:hypothetical protein